MTRGHTSHSVRTTRMRLFSKYSPSPKFVSVGREWCPINSRGLLSRWCHCCAWKKWCAVRVGNNKRLMQMVFFFPPLIVIIIWKGTERKRKNSEGSREEEEEDILRLLIHPALSAFSDSIHYTLLTLQLHTTTGGRSKSFCFVPPFFLAPPPCPPGGLFAWIV